MSPEAPGSLRVLFIGNSLTYTNDLPAMVAAIAEAERRAFVYESVAVPNYSLEDHWYMGDARRVLASAEWDFVVMQQGPSSLPENQELLREWSERWAEEARLSGTEPALYMVWPSEERSSYFLDVIESYTAAAGAVDGLLLPAGTAWLAAWDRDSSLQLYGVDDFHPSQMGTYLAALVVYGGLFDSALDNIPASLSLEDGTDVTIATSRARVLREAATEALAGR